MTCAAFDIERFNQPISMCVLVFNARSLIRYSQRRDFFTQLKVRNWKREKRGVLFYSSSSPSSSSSLNNAQEISILNDYVLKHREE